MKKTIFVNCCSLCLILFFGGFPLVSISDSCVKCHSDQKLRVHDLQLFEYYNVWKTSRHFLAGVKCVNCHGGNANAKSKTDAHPVNLSVRDKASPIYYSNIPNTCGQCHNNVQRHYTSSKHYANLQQGEGPNCITCHSAMGPDMPYTRVVESICQGCHGGDGSPSVTKTALAALQQVNAAQGFLGWFKINQEGKTKQLATSKERFNQSYANIAANLHEFDLIETEADAADLLRLMQASYDELNARGKSSRSDFSSFNVRPGYQKH